MARNGPVYGSVASHGKCMPGAQRVVPLAGPVRTRPKHCGPGRTAGPARDAARCALAGTPERHGEGEAPAYPIIIFILLLFDYQLSFCCLSLLV